MRVALPFVLVAVAACAGPDRAESALISLDREARAAGIEVEVAGERLAPELPLAIDPSEPAWVVQGDEREQVVAVPGEWVEITGADGTMHRGPIDPNRLALTGDASSAASLAELLGAGLVPMGDDRWALDAPDVVWIAAMFARDRQAAPGLGSSAFANRLAGGDVAWVDRGGPALSASDAPIVTDGSVPDAAALVGVYRHADVVLVLDASGGYSLVTRTTHRHGQFATVPGGARLTSDDGEVVDLDLSGEALSGAGLALAPVSAGGAR